MSTILRTQRTLTEKIVFAISVLLFGLLNLIPGLLTGGAYADAQYGGGGGGGSLCPQGCPGGKVDCCNRAETTCYIDKQGQKVCETSTYYFYKS